MVPNRIPFGQCNFDECSEKKGGRASQAPRLVWQVRQLGAVQRIKRCREHGRGVSHTKRSCEIGRGWGECWPWWLHSVFGNTWPTRYTPNCEMLLDALRYIHVRSYFTVLQLVLQFMHNKGRRPAHQPNSPSPPWARQRWPAVGGFSLQ